jgi:hypothetical protein
MPSSAPTCGAITGLSLYDTTTGTSLFSLVDGATIDISETGDSLTVIADMCRPVYSSVDFYFDGAFVRTERIPPYTLTGNDNNLLWPYEPLAVPGPHNITATALNDGGLLVDSYTATFETVAPV